VWGVTLADQLTEARAAYHRLQLGEAAVTFVDQNGERVEFRPTPAPKLAAYIADLERQLARRSRPASLKVTTSKGLQT
jgi:hypothetical protein